MKNAILASCAAILAMAACLAIYLSFAIPKQKPAPNITVNLSPERVERGRYLAEHVVLCNDCHAQRDWSLYGGPVVLPVAARPECISGRTNADGVIATGISYSGVFIRSEHDFPGVLCIRNLSPDPETGLGDWTDGEIYRAIREGIDKDGQGIFPVMPYFIYRKMADDDVRALVAYLRSQPAIQSLPVKKEIRFPENLFAQLWPQPLHRAVKIPGSASTVAYGRYLAEIARCEFCHTPRRGLGRESAPDRAFAGGVPFEIGGDVIYSSNLTSHEAGLKNWSRETFIAKFREFRLPRKVPPEDNTRMNWQAYSGMTDADLGAIYDYLQSLDPVAPRWRR